MKRAMIVLFYFHDRYIPRAAAVARRGHGKSPSLVSDTGFCASGKFEDFRIISDRPQIEPENEGLSKIRLVRSSRTSIKLVNLYLFLDRTISQVLENSPNSTRDFRWLEIYRTLVHPWVGFPADSDITLPFFNYTGHKLCKFFGPKGIEWSIAEYESRFEHSKIDQIQLAPTETL